MPSGPEDTRQLTFEEWANDYRELQYILRTLLSREVNFRPIENVETGDYL